MQTSWNRSFFVLVPAMVFICVVCFVSAGAQPPEPTPSPASSQIENPAPPLIPMVKIPAGRFLMGSPKDEPTAFKDERPQHWVTITKPFMLGVTEITQSQYEQATGTNRNRYHRINGDNYPEDNISWYEALEFCNRLSDREGFTRCYARPKKAQWALRDFFNGLLSADPTWQLAALESPAVDGGAGRLALRGYHLIIQWDRDCTGYRLPTEAEWEYAARAGTTSPIYTGGLTIYQEDFRDCAPELNEIAWNYCSTRLTTEPDDECTYWSRGRRRSAICGPHPVALKRPNAWGFYDMLGNVEEWVWDKWGSYSCLAQTDPTGRNTYWNFARVTRGGGFDSDVDFCRSASRSCETPLFGAGGGFRVARSIFTARQ